MSRARAGVAWLSLALLGAWTVRFGPLGPGLPGAADLAWFSRPLGGGQRGWLVAVAALVLAGAWRRRPARLSEASGQVAAAVAVALVGSLLVEVGHLLLFAAAAAAAAVLVSLQLPFPTRRAPGSWLPAALYGAVAVTFAVFSLHRHRSFGSGSWDLGCMAHNFYRASRGLSTVSTVLGDVDFLGDHFMPGIYLLAPLFWVDASASMVLLVQAASLAVVAPALYGIARRHGAGPEPAAALAVAVGLGFGMQSAAYFDAHEITVGFGFLAAAFYALETGRLGWATASLVVFSLFKESLGAYVAFLGLFLLVTAGPDPRRRRFGAAWLVYGAVWFVAVNRVLKPWFAAGGRITSHETFTDFGPTLFTALLGMLADPLRTAAVTLIPAEKGLSLGVTLIGAGGGLALGAPSVLLAAAPLVAERFLSSKESMWQMGYHYAAPLTLYAGWAAARALPAATAWVATGLQRIEPSGSRSAARALALYFVFVGLLVNGFGYRHPANFHVWRESYFSTADKQRDNAAAVAFVRGFGREAKVAAQNRILPHLADRPWIWRLGEHKKANLVVLSLDESAWPYSDRFPAQLAAQLDRDPEWSVAFEAGLTRVYERRGDETDGLAPAGSAR